MQKLLASLVSFGRTLGRSAPAVKAEVAPSCPTPDPPAVPVATSAGLRAPQSGQLWVYLEASDVDVASVVRAIDGVQKVTRERGGIWKVVADREIGAEATRNIVTKGGALTMLVNHSQLHMLDTVRR